MGGDAPQRGLHPPAGPARGEGHVSREAAGGRCRGGGMKMAVRRGGLAVLLLLLPLFLVIRAETAGGPLPAASSEAFDSVLGNTASCHRACQLTYPLHTYPKVRAGPSPHLRRCLRLPRARHGPAPAPLPPQLQLLSEGRYFVMEIDG